jgi:hypothetical protein
MKENSRLIHFPAAAVNLPPENNSKSFFLTASEWKGITITGGIAP